MLSAHDKVPPLTGRAAAITDDGGERHAAAAAAAAAALRPPAVEAEVVDVVAQLTDVLVQALPFLEEKSSDLG